jgi:type I restriction-modification system DNA methylase subunit
MTAKRAPVAPSEVNAYRFIYEELSHKKGWKKDQIFEQQECYKINGVKEGLGTQKPEAVVEVDATRCYVIEGKNERKKLGQALKEARDYADAINAVGKTKVAFISGIAGNDAEGFIAKSQYLRNGVWETITENEIELTSLVSKDQVEIIQRSNSSSIKDVEISSEEFFRAAEEINEILHDNAINKDYRARFISALLLALSDGSDINLDEKNTSVLIHTINAKVEAILHKFNKREFSKFIKIDEPSSADNHIKVRNAIVKTVQSLLGLNIRSAMNSGRDILGHFYEVFLKYGNGAKEIGIVLTPRHVTSFAAATLDIQANDLVLDPACGTGGFLVAAFDEVRRKSTNSDVESFKEHGMYGIEEQDPVIALAIVNMIFRGDGKNNMIEGNCFNKWLGLKTSDGHISATYKNEDEPGRIPPITKVMMNPPFAQKSSKSKEFHFIEHALKQMQNDGVLFAVLPISVLIEKSTLQWRQDLLKSNTLLSVVTFPVDLFYPTGTHTLGLYIKKGVPHSKDSSVLWIRALSDGYIKKKGKRVKSAKVKDDLHEVIETVKSFIKNPSIKIPNVPYFQKAAPVDFDDKTFELIPEIYLDGAIPTRENIEESIESLMRETASYLIRTKVKK